jgi:predicted thioredoxin/glutaredoxin
LLRRQTLTGCETFIEDACAQLLSNFIREIFWAANAIERRNR